MVPWVEVWMELWMEPWVEAWVEVWVEMYHHLLWFLLPLLLHQLQWWTISRLPINLASHQLCTQLLHLLKLNLEAPSWKLTARNQIECLQQSSLTILSSGQCKSPCNNTMEAMVSLIHPLATIVLSLHLEAAIKDTRTGIKTPEDILAMEAPTQTTTTAITTRSFSITAACLITAMTTCGAAVGAGVAVWAATFLQVELSALAATTLSHQWETRIICHLHLLVWICLTTPACLQTGTTSWRQMHSCRIFLPQLVLVQVVRSTWRQVLLEPQVRIGLN